MLGPARLSPVPRLAAMFAFPLTFPSGMSLPTDPTFNLPLLSLLLHGDVADSASLQGTLLGDIVGLLTQDVRHNFF